MENFSRGNQNTILWVLQVLLAAAFFAPAWLPIVGEDSMRPIKALWLALALLVPAVLHAGQIYGTIVSEGQGLKGVNVEIQCGKEEPVSGSTAADGAYRINVPQQGQCTLSLPSYEGRPSAVIFSSPNPTLYNFELTKLANGKHELRRR